MSTVFDEATLEEHVEIDLSVLPSLHAEPEQAIVLALDIGTSGTRAALFDKRDHLLGRRPADQKQRHVVPGQGTV